jgi:hypothetical protein
VSGRGLRLTVGDHPPWWGSFFPSWGTEENQGQRRGECTPLLSASWSRAAHLVPGLGFAITPCFEGPGLQSHHHLPRAETGVLGLHNNCVRQFSQQISFHVSVCLSIHTHIPLVLCLQGTDHRISFRKVLTREEEEVAGALAASLRFCFREKERERERERAQSICIF